MNATVLLACAGPLRLIACAQNSNSSLGVYFKFIMFVEAVNKATQHIHTGVVLINLGSPDSPAVSDVRRYLREFLSDARVVDLPNPARWLLVNGIIAPFRAPKSAREYRKIWHNGEFPLIAHTRNLALKVQQQLGEEFEVMMAMRYQNPNLEHVIQACENKKYRRLVIVPLFPQYASATTGSINEKVMTLISSWRCIPELIFIDSFCSHRDLAAAYGRVWQDSKTYQEDGDEWDHYLFSYHGLPERHLLNENQGCLKESCCENYTKSNRLCYRAQCFETSRQLMDYLSLDANQCTTCFQSRLGKLPWIQPYTRDVIMQLAQQGIKRLLVFCPAFTADCLETIVEVGEQYRELFIAHGGEELRLVESLNDHPAWVDVLERLITLR